MKFDSVIIGGGLAGLVCGIRLSKAGRRCAIISSGQSALHFSSGSFDLLGALPDGTPVTAPAESVAETIRQAPEHPYARIGAERFGALAAEAAALLAEAGDAEAVLLPAVLGIDRRDAAAQLERQAGRPVAMVATLPPSVPGLQAQLQLRRYFQQSGGVYMLGDTAVRYEAEGGRITALYTADHGDIAFEADSYVLATGSYFSQGLVAGMDGVREPLFGLDVACAADRGAWYDRDLFAAQPFELFGVKCDERLRGLRDGRAVENLYAIGAGLAGFNPVKEGCGAGVSMLTALAAAERILNE